MPWCQISNSWALYFDHTAPQWVVQGERFPLPYDIDERAKSQINWQWDVAKNELHQQQLASHPDIQCKGHDICPLAGLYRPQIDGHHPSADLVNRSVGVFVSAGEVIPQFGLSQDTEALITWRWVQPPRT